MPRILLALLLLTLALPAAAQGRRANADTAPAPEGTVLADLLHRVPRDAAGFVHLTDIAAARRQTGPLTPDAPGPEDRLLIPWSVLTPPPGFGHQYLFAHLDDPARAIGLPIFDIDQMAGWGDPPAVPVIVTGIAPYHDAMAAAFTRDGMQVKPVDGHEVWSSGDDFETDLINRDDNPFGGHLGMSKRFVLDGDTLLAARSWAGIETLLDPGRNLATDPDAAAILNAAYGYGAGDVINAVLVRGQPSLSLDAASLIIGGDLSTDEIRERIRHIPAFNMPGLPRFSRYGLVLWQDGRTLTGAIVIPYVRPDLAKRALARFTDLFERGTSIQTRRPFTELFPWDRRFGIVETGDYSVLVLAFEYTVDPAEPVNMTNLRTNPYHRLLDMAYKRDIDLLIGAGP